MCLGVYERGDEDELDWGDESYETDKKERATAKKMNSADLPANEWEPLTEWKGAAIVTTQCTNAGAVIEWVLVPFIEDETEFEDGLSINETLQPEANGEDLTNDEAEL